MATEFNPAQPLSVVLAKHHPEFDESVGETLREVSERVIGAQLSGSVTVKFQVGPGPSGSVIVKPSIASKMPHPTAETSVLWVDDDGTFAASNPAQYRLGFDPAPESATTEGDQP